jgi:hypothetical protein
MVDGNLSKGIIFILLSNVWFGREVGEEDKKVFEEVIT